ncbi:MAG: glycosyltransferase [Bacteroidetes bacterium]|nr:glycosyltransferase [Bacteroidota bacterium]
MFTTKKIAVVSVINDLVTDNRVNKTCLALIECGYEVVLIGRELPNSLPIKGWPFTTIRMRLLFLKGPLFYFFFNFRLFFKLLFKKADLLLANDLDTLLPNYWVSKIKNVPLIYDSHELFCEVPELLESPIKRKIWLRIEKGVVPKLKNCITVNESIAKIFEEKYKVKFHSVKNISAPIENFIPLSKQQLGLPVNKKIILLQGAGINIDRGAEELIDAMKFVDNAFLLIIGGGDCWNILQKKVKDQNLSGKILLIDKMPKLQLTSYTFNADLGISIDKNTNLNYYYSLPNKIFDYLQAGIPILASRLPEIEKIITAYKVGDFIDDHKPETIAKKINQILSAEELLQEYKGNAKVGAAELNWTNEKQKLITIINKLV